MNRLCCSALTLSLSSAALAGEAPVQICLGEGNEWPPYTYWERQDGKIDQSRLTGAATTMVLDALQQLGLQHRIQYLPWARVQQELAEFASNNRCELTWDASYKPERAAYAHYSVPLYQTHLGLFYSARRFNQPPSTPRAAGQALLRGHRLQLRALRRGPGTAALPRHPAGAGHAGTPALRILP